MPENDRPIPEVVRLRNARLALASALSEFENALIAYATWTAREDGAA